MVLFTCVHIDVDEHLGLEIIEHSLCNDLDIYCSIEACFIPLPLARPDAAVVLI